MDSIQAVNKAADDLAEACRALCPDLLAAALREVYDEVLAEGVKPEERELMGRMQ